MELRVWASERGVWIAKWPAVAIVVDDVRMSLLQRADFRGQFEVVGAL